MSQYDRIAQSLTDSLKLRLPPVAVCFSDAPPESIPVHQGKASAGCQFWQEGAANAFQTSAQDHETCVIGMHTHHMPFTSKAQETDLNDALKVFADLGYVRPQDLPNIPVLKKESKHVVYAPLASTPLPPDAVLLFAHSQQGLIITEAIQQVEPETPPALGRPACAIVPQVVNSGKAALSLGCCGARAYLDALSDDVALWALPGAKIAEYAERIEALAKANAILEQFHTLRRKDIEGGMIPSIQQSLARLQAAG